MLLQEFWHGCSMAYCSWQVLFISIENSAGSFPSEFTAYQKQGAVFSWDHNILYIHLASIPIGGRAAELAFPLQSTPAKHALGSQNLSRSGRDRAGSLLSLPVTCKRLLWTSENYQHANCLQDGLSYSGILSACSVNIILIFSFHLPAHSGPQTARLSQAAPR